MSVSWWSLLMFGVSGACAGGRPHTPPPVAVEAPPELVGEEDDLPPVVAEIGGVAVTREELLAESGQQLQEAEVERLGARTKADIDLDRARREAVDALVLRKVVEAEAASRGTTVEQLMETEVRAKVPPISDAEVDRFYAENKSQIQGSLEEVRPQVSAYLDQERQMDAARAYFDDLRAKAKVEILLSPLRVEVAAGDSPRWGKESAPVQIIEFSDFQCPYCTDAAETIDEVKKKYGDKVSVVYRHFPLPMHPQAHRAAQAAECAHEQGGFWKFHDALFADRKAWTDEDYERYAKDADLDADKLVACVASGRHAATVDTDVQEGRAVGMSGTPGFYVNGVMLNGAQPLAAFSEVIDAELANL